MPTILRLDDSQARYRSASLYSLRETMRPLSLVQGCTRVNRKLIVFVSYFKRIPVASINTMLLATEEDRAQSATL